MDSTALRTALKKYYGYDQFRPMQEEIILSLMSGKDILVIMPTGGGKSICFQLPAILMPGTCIVVSPLIALMKDQVEGLRASGIKAAYLNSSQDPPEQRAVENDFFNGNLDLLYISPEKLVSSGFFPLLSRVTINLIAIDEAHCISAWGHDFRPEYTQLNFLKQHFPNIPVIALTATADKITRKDISGQLRLPHPETFIASFDRPNLQLTVRPGQQRLPQILQFLKNHQGESGIIYTLSRKSTEELASKLRDVGYKAEAYHAGLSARERSRVQEAFINDNAQIICATIAFGMGIDKSNVRWVIHYNLPKNIESYYQEIGRAGRDGANAETILFYSYNDIKVLQDILSESPPELAELQLTKLERMQQYAEAQVCRRRILLGYFGESLEKNCGNCDVCKNPPQYFDGTVIAQKALSAIVRMGQSAPLTTVIDVLRGSGKKELREKGYDQIKTFGAGRDLSQFDWYQYLHQLINLGYIEIAYDQKNALKIMPAAEPVLFGKESIQLSQATTIKEKAAPAERIKPIPEQQRDELFEILRQLRKTLAQEKGVPPYIIFTDVTLEAMAQSKPLSPADLQRVHGVGEAKLAAYGEYFLEAIRDYVDAHSASIRGSTQRVSAALFKEGLSIEAIAERRELTASTVLGHIASSYEQGEDLDISVILPEDALQAILQSLKYLPDPCPLKTIFEYFDGKYSYDQIKLTLAHRKRFTQKVS
jgi:ATP-dependent DNA helicase RecQ